jgi:hypothetical protein
MDTAKVDSSSSYIHIFFQKGLDMAARNTAAYWVYIFPGKFNQG